ncbi:hypothetical protein [Actinoallomurus soli]|uniref:hypothetical protein n=1 Tax=Actinoallomurus soli TaxID=2952535 RepID=UPI0020922302|nr:hypothetical protein [Actinoallomurus soli]
MATAERALGRDPELDRMALVRAPAEVSALQGPHTYYLEAVVRRHAEASSRGDTEKPR